MIERRQLTTWLTNPSTTRKQSINWQQNTDSNAGSSRVAECPSHKVPEHDFGHVQSSKQHADGTSRLARYDFLFVFYSDLKFTWHRSRVLSRQSKQTVITPNKIKKQKTIQSIRTKPALDLSGDYRPSFVYNSILDTLPIRL